MDPKKINEMLRKQALRNSSYNMKLSLKKLLKQILFITIATIFLVFAIMIGYMAYYHTLNIKTVIIAVIFILIILLLWRIIKKYLMLCVFRKTYDKMEEEYRRIEEELNSEFEKDRKRFK